MPPKDAFEGLFLSASGSKTKQNATLNQQQKLLPLGMNMKDARLGQWSDLDLLYGGGSEPGTIGTSSVVGSVGSGSANVFQPGSVLVSRGLTSPIQTQVRSAMAAASAIPSATGPSSYKAGTDFDPFDIFNQPSHKPLFSVESSLGNNSGSLLDDDFTDAFTPEPVAQPSSRPTPPLTRNTSLNQESRAQFPDSVPPRTASPSTAKDAVLAELVDIGFPVDISNRAIAEMGPDVQKCVNAIMEGRFNENVGSAASQKSPKQPNLNDLSSEIFSKASFFLNKGKETVMKNIAEFQQKPKADPSRPAWMKNQAKYKDWLGTDTSTAETERVKLEDELPMRRRPDRRANNITREPPSQSPSPAPSSSSSVKVNYQDPGHQEPSLFSQDAARFKSSSSLSLPKSPNPNATTLATPVSVSVPASDPTPLVEEFDLLGLSSNSSGSGSSSDQKLDQFLQTDFDKFKRQATLSFTNGDYDIALSNYRKCLEILPSHFDERIVILSNLALTSSRIGNFKQTKIYCENGLSMIGEDKLRTSVGWKIYDKPIKSWYIKLLMRKAESLEMLELFPEALLDYLELIQQFGVNDKKVMDGKRRVDNIVNPQKAAPPKPASKRPQASTQPKTTTSTNLNSNSKKVADQFAKQKQEEDAKFVLHDKIQQKITLWSNGKEENLRALLVGLPEVIPLHLNFPFLSKATTINDVMLPKKVKITYLKVISAIHPDKLGKLELEDKMICQGVFIILNKSWDLFKDKEL